MSTKPQPTIGLVNTYGELLQALADQQVQITLGADIIVRQNILINYDVAINFNGHSLIADETRTNLRVLDIRRGEVTLTGEGRIFAMGRNGVAVRIFGAISTGIRDYSQLIVDDKIHLYAPDGSGILIAPNLGAAFGTTVHFAGEIIARNGISLGAGVRGMGGILPFVHIKSGAQIIADESAGAAIDAAGYGRWQIDSAKLLGAHGLRLNFGEFTLINPQVVSGQATFLVDSSDIDTPLKVDIDGGSYLSEEHLIFAGQPHLERVFLLKNGDFCGKYGIVTPELADALEVIRANFRTDSETFSASLAPENPLETLPDLDIKEHSEPAKKRSFLSRHESSSASTLKPAPKFANLPTQPILRPVSEISTQEIADEPNLELVSLSDLELDRLFDEDQEVRHIVGENWHARSILIDETVPVKFSAAAFRKAHIKVHRKKSSSLKTFAKSFNAGLHAGFDVFRETRARAKI